MIDLHAPYDHLEQIGVLHIIIQAPIGRQMRVEVERK
jgi:hypothetical protein